MPSPTKDKLETSKLRDNLEEFRTKFMDVFELSRDGILILQDGDIVLTNKAFCELLGYAPGILVDTAFEDYFDPLELRYHSEKLDSIKYDKTATAPFQTTLKKSDNGIVHVEICTKVLIHDNKESILVVVKDITENVELRKMTTELQVRFESFFQAIPVAHFILTSKGIIQDANQAAFSLLQYNPEELKGLDITDLIPKENPMYRMCMQVVRETLLKKRIINAEIQLVRKDCTPVWVSVTTFSLGDESDRFVSIDFMAEDIDRRKQAEQHAQVVRERADLYLEVLTHDMTNVTQNSELTIELLRSSLNIPKELDSIIEEATWDLRRGSRMIANMRTLVQLEETHLVKRGFEVQKCLERTATKVSEDFPQKILKMNVNFPSDDLKVEGHDYLEIVFYNILHNAMTYDQRKEVDIEVVVSKIDDEQLIKFEFLDNGPGVPDELKEHIFKRTGSPTEQIVGRGLGLTLADRIVRDLDGKIWVEDRVKGKSHLGSRFVLLLPSWREEQRPWGTDQPIIFYKSNHCVFCGPMLDTLTAILREMGISFDAVRLVNIDNPDAEIIEDDLIVLPTIEMGDTILTGLVDEYEIRSSVMNLMKTW